MAGFSSSCKFSHHGAFSSAQLCKGDGRAKRIQDVPVAGENATHGAGCRLGARSLRSFALCGRGEAAWWDSNSFGSSVASWMQQCTSVCTLPRCLGELVQWRIQHKEERGSN